MKKNITLLFLSILFITLGSCSGSETYRGKWFATDSDGNKNEIFFTAEKMTLKQSETDSLAWTYSQNSVSIENSTSKYGIKLDNGSSYTVYFPTGDKTKGAITDANDNVIYTIGRSQYFTYDDVFGLH